MRCFALLVAMLVLCPLADCQRKPQVEVLEIRGRRSQENIVIEGKLKISNDKPIKGLILSVHFLNSAGAELMMRKAQVEEDTLKDGDEAVLSAEIPSPAGAIRFKIEAFDGADRSLRISKSGPFTIE